MNLTAKWSAAQLNDPDVEEALLLAWNNPAATEAEREAARWVVLNYRLERDTLAGASGNKVLVH